MMTFDFIVSYPAICWWLNTSRCYLTDVPPNRNRIILEEMLWGENFIFFFLYFWMSNGEFSCVQCLQKLIFSKFKASIISSLLKHPIPFSILNIIGLAFTKNLNKKIAITTIVKFVFKELEIITIFLRFLPLRCSLFTRSRMDCACYVILLLK